jgi:CHAT domain-containing protein
MDSSKRGDPGVPQVQVAILERQARREQKMNIEELRQRMGVEATTDEAERMALQLKRWNISEVEEISEHLSDAEFFALIPRCF